MVSTVDVIE